MDYAVTVGMGARGYTEKDQRRFAEEAEEAKRAYARGSFHLTVGELIKQLSALDPTMPVGCMYEDDSYAAEKLAVVQSNFQDKSGRRVIGDLAVVE